MKATGLAATLAIVTLGIGAAIVAGSVFAPRCTPLTGDETVSASVDDLRPGTAQFYCYRDRNGRELRFVIARQNDGTLRSVFDACRQCYRYHKGYTITDGFLVCRLCGNRYKIDQMQDGVASCQPVHLEHNRRGNKVEIKVAALEQGQALF